MKKIEFASDLRTWADKLRNSGKTVALVPTMGALHPGKEALVRAAVKKADAVVVSIFVNPLQFSPNESIDRYPRRMDEDLRICEACKAQAVFIPPIEEMFPRGHATFVTEEAISRPLCGLSRPNHFRGVTTVTAKLLVLVRPDYAFFGQKSAQRAAVVRKMAHDLGFGVEIVVSPTVREPDGLAAGVRNPELTATQRGEALAISRALARMKEMADSGARSTDRLVAEATHILGQHRRIRIIYAAIVDPQTMEAAREVTPGKCMAAIAAWVDEIRLVDNMML